MLGIVSEEDTDGSSKVKQVVNNEKATVTNTKKTEQDYVAIFAKYISGKQPKEAVLKAFKMYESKLTKEQHEQIHKMISNYK